MAKFTATVRLLDIEGEDRKAARHELEQKLQTGKVGRYQVIALDASPSPLPVRQPADPERSRLVDSSVGPVLLLLALTWTLWFYWLLFE